MGGGFMVSFFLLIACQAEIERQCFIEYVEASSDVFDDTVDCFDRADTEDDVEECSDDGTDELDSLRDDVEECAGDGCLTDWLDCAEDADDEQEAGDCYQDLEECGGWMDADAAKDCDDDLDECIEGLDDTDDVKRCFNRAYDCLIDAAGG